MNTIERIFALIKSKGITEKQFYEDLEFGKDKLSQWKNGKTESYRKYINQIANYLNTSVSYLLCETDDPTPPNQKELTPEEREKLIDEAIERDRERMHIIGFEGEGHPPVSISNEEFYRALEQARRNRGIVIENGVKDLSPDETELIAIYRKLDSIKKAEYRAEMKGYVKAKEESK